MKKSTKKVKKQTTKRRSSKSDGDEAQMPSLVEAMLKLTERLEAVERKMDLVVSQTANRQQQPQRPAFQNQPRHEQRQPQHNHSHQNAQSHQNQNFNRPPQPQNPSNLNRGQGRPMFQTTCADCGKSCEVPFKPTGERPIYCKECFGVRKSGGQSQKTHTPSPSVPFEKRQLKVVRNGVGRTVISEMVAVSERQSHPAKKISKPAKKSKR